jgi:hypothetical protein
MEKMQIPRISLSPLGLPSGQTLGQLSALSDSVEEALQSGDGDPEYWDAVQKRLRIHKAKAQVRDIMSKLFSVALNKMASRAKEADAGGGDQTAGVKAPAAGSGVPADDNELLLYEEEEDEVQRRRMAGVGAETAQGPMDDGEPGEGDRMDEDGPKDDDEDDEDDEETAIDESDGRYSPPPVDRVLFAGQDVIAEDDDIRLAAGSEGVLGRLCRVLGRLCQGRPLSLTGANRSLFSPVSPTGPFLLRQLELLRQSVLLQEAVRFKVASNCMATVGPNHGTGIGVDNEMRNIKGNQPVHPMFRNLASQVGGAEGLETQCHECVCVCIV